MRNQLTLIPIKDTDEPLAIELAAKMGRFDSNFVYADYQDVSCIQYTPRKDGDKQFTIIKTKEFGLMAVMDTEDARIGKFA